ncbi:MAG TPA: hypothetical protein VF209_03900 [Patescibacteria group bacterium]
MSKEIQLPPEDDFSSETEDEFIPAAERIRQFNDQFGNLREASDPQGEATQCLRLVETFVRSGELSVETLTAIFQRAHKNIPTGATYLLAYRAIETAIEVGNFSKETLQIVQDSIMADVDPIWSKVGMQDKYVQGILQRLFTNQHLFELMLPYIGGNGEDGDDEEDNLVDHEVAPTDDNLTIGTQVEYMSRECEVVGFEEEDGETYVLLHSIHKQPNGRPTSSWKVNKMFFSVKSILNQASAEVTE